MNALFLLIPTAFVILAFAVWILFWAVKNGQYDDLDTEGHRILFDDTPSTKNKNTDTSPK